MTEFYAFADETHPEIDLQIRALLRNGLQGLEIRDVDGTNISEITEEKAREWFELHEISVDIYEEVFGSVEE